MRTITELLGALDDKIESNTRVARAGLDVMRLDFDRRFGPTGELMQPCQALETVAEVVMGQSPPGATYSADSADGMPMVQGMGAFGERFVEPTTFTSSPTKVVAAGTLLMTVRAPVGSLNLTTERTCVGRGVAALATEWPAFVECSLREMAPRWQSEAGGTIYPSVNGRQVREAPVTAADRADVDAFEEFATPLRDRALALHHEARHLTAIRDALLPRLVSGRIRAPLTNDLDEAVETVLDAA
jgi:type I restriction enzyme S subunit